MKTTLLFAVAVVMLMFCVIDAQACGGAAAAGFHPFQNAAHRRADRREARRGAGASTSVTVQSGCPCSNGPSFSIPQNYPQAMPSQKAPSVPKAAYYQAPPTYYPQTVTVTTGRTGRLLRSTGGCPGGVCPAR